MKVACGGRAPNSASSQKNAPANSPPNGSGVCLRWKMRNLRKMQLLATSQLQQLRRLHPGLTARFCDMDAAAILERLAALGVKLQRNGTNLIASPKAAMADELRTMIRTHRAELLAAL